MNVHEWHQLDTVWEWREVAEDLRLENIRWVWVLGGNARERGGWVNEIGEFAVAGKLGEIDTYFQTRSASKCDARTHAHQ
jgi:hypothetical protein